MKLRRGATLLGIAAAGAVLFMLLTVLFVPASVLLQAANRGMAQYGLHLTAASFGKALPLGIKGTGITLSSASGELVSLAKGRLSVALLPLFAGRVVVNVKAAIGAGSLDASLSLLRQPATSIAIRNVRLEDIPFFRTVAAMKTSGILSGKVETTGLLARANGSVRLEVQGAELSGIKLGEMPLPDASYRTVQGAVSIKEGKGTIESFTLQGDDLYVRLKGALPLADPLPATPLDLTLELMPKPALLDKQKLIFLLLLRFQDTPGHYQIPVKGTLGKPQVL